MNNEDGVKCSRVAKTLERVQLEVMSRCIHRDWNAGRKPTGRMPAPPGMGIRPMAGPDRPPFTRADITASGTRLETTGEIPGAFGRESCLNANSMKAVPCPTRPRPARNFTAAGAIALAGAVSLAASGEAEPDGATAFFVYAVCFGVGLLFTVVSAVAATRLAATATSDTRRAAMGRAAMGRATRRAGTTRATSGIFAAQPDDHRLVCHGVRRVWDDFQPARHHKERVDQRAARRGRRAGDRGGGALAVPHDLPENPGLKRGRVADLAGLEATVITPITADRVGEIAYVQLGSRYSAPARAEGGVTFANGATVKITRVVGTQFYVATP